MGKRLKRKVDVVTPPCTGRHELTVHPYELLRVHFLKTRFFAGDDPFKGRRLVLLNSLGCKETRVAPREFLSRKHLMGVK